MLSLPSWERGLKLIEYEISITEANVAPLVGAWIEISTVFPSLHVLPVAPLVGAWIEIAWNLGYTFAAPRRSPRGSVD